MARTSAPRSRRSSTESRLQAMLRGQAKVRLGDIALAGPVELVVLAIKEGMISCRLPGEERVVTLRSGMRMDVAPGLIISVHPKKFWTCAGHPYLSGDILAVRLDVASLNLTPLRLEGRGIWRPDEHCWGEDDQEPEDWAKPIIAHGPRPAFEMEECVPGAVVNDFDSDPILEAVQRRQGGDRVGAIRLLMGLCQADLRCLDGHAHLGSFWFDHWPAWALLYFEVGFRIGQSSMGPNWEGLLPWGCINNRPFLRCMHGYGLCLWRLGRFEEASSIFHDLLWLNPTDNQGIRFLVDEVKAGRPWGGAEDE